MKSLITIILGLAASLRYSDLQAETFTHSTLAPLGVFVFGVWLALWLVFNAGFGKQVKTRKGLFGGYGGFGDGGAD